MQVPNGLALSPFGALLASDSFDGSIWQMALDPDSEDDSVAAVWLQDPALAGCDPTSPGANGIAFYRGDLYVANTSRGALLHVPVSPEGVPDTPVVVAGDLECDQSDPLFGLDGIAIDTRGTVYAARVLHHEVLRIDPVTGTHEVLLTQDDGLWNPASLALQRDGDSQSLFITNYALRPPAQAGNLGPAVLRYDIG